MDSIFKELSFFMIWVSISAIVFLFLGVICGETLLKKYKEDKEKQNKAMITIAIISAFIGIVVMCAKGMIL